MTSLRIRHPALDILDVTNAYPAPERPAYGIYVARLVAALERDGHEVALVASSEEGGGWRSLRKYARLALKARSAVRSLTQLHTVPSGRVHVAVRSGARLSDQPPSWTRWW